MITRRLTRPRRITESRRLWYSPACPRSTRFVSVANSEGGQLMQGKSRHLKRPRIDPKPIQAGISLVDLVDGTFLAYNGARLREACQLFARKMLENDVTIGMSLTGALTPAG